MATTPGGSPQRNRIHTSRVPRTKLGQGKSRKCKEKPTLQWKHQACTYRHDIVRKAGQGGWGFNRAPRGRREKPTRSASAVGRCKNPHFREGLGVLPRRRPAETCASSPAMAAGWSPSAEGRGGCGEAARPLAACSRCLCLWVAVETTHSSCRASQGPPSSPRPLRTRAPALEAKRDVRAVSSALGEVRPSQGAPLSRALLP